MFVFHLLCAITPPMLTACTTFFSAELPSCITSFTVKGKLEASTNYRWVLTDKFGIKLNGVATTDTEGTIIISDSSLQNLLRSFSGSFKLQVFLVGSDEAVDFTMCDDVAYPGIVFSTYDWNGATPPPIIGNCE